MKIKHTLKRDGKVISGKITETIFEYGERADSIRHYTEDGEFFIISTGAPELWTNKALFVWGNEDEDDNKKISYTYEREEEAKQVMSRIDEFTLSELEFKEGDWVYVRDNFDDKWKKRIFLHKLPLGSLYNYLAVDEFDEEKYKDRDNYDFTTWKHIKPYKEMIKIKTENGNTIEISKDKAKDLGFKIKE